MAQPLTLTRIVSFLSFVCLARSRLPSISVHLPLCVAVAFSTVSSIAIAKSHCADRMSSLGVRPRSSQFPKQSPLLCPACEHFGHSLSLVLNVPTCFGVSFFTYLLVSLLFHAGLKNPGCVCYLNSSMQQLFMIPSLRRDILAAVSD